MKGLTLHEGRQQLEIQLASNGFRIRDIEINVSPIGMETGSAIIQMPSLMILLPVLTAMATITQITGMKGKPSKTRHFANARCLSK